MSKLEKIIEEAKKHSYDVRVRDVGYATLVVGLGDEDLAHKLIFGDDGNAKTYKELPHIKYLVNHLKAEDLKRKESKEAEDIAKLIAQSKGKRKNDADGSMTFEENREGIETQLREIVELKKEAMNPMGDEQGADLKTLALLQKTEADLRVKLNDKFGAAEKTAEQYIIVQPKFNHICEITRRECWLQTKDYAMEHWHLIEDPDYKDNNE